MVRTVASAALAFALLQGGAVAADETPEEAVAYAFYGLTDDAQLTHGSVKLEWQEISASPAMFTGHGESPSRRYDVTLTVTAKSDCDFEVQIAGPPNLVRGGKALYAQISLDKVDGIAAEPLAVQIDGSGYCQTGSLNPECIAVHKTDLFGALDPQKHARLVARLHADICAKP